MKHSLTPEKPVLLKAEKPVLLKAIIRFVKIMIYIQGSPYYSSWVGKTLDE